MKDENVLKHPKNPTENNNNKFLLVGFKDTNIPKKNDAIKFTKEILLILLPTLMWKLYFINNLKVNPKVLPKQRKTNELRSKI